MIDTVIDLIFKGDFSAINHEFLKEFMTNSEDSHFNTPEVNITSSYNDVMEVFKANSYADFVITNSSINLNENILKHVFINVTLDSGYTELLLFFDIKDLSQIDNKKKLDLLREWAMNFQNRYGFKYFVCQMDNGDEKEFYFDTKGLGPLYSVA